MLTNKSQNIIKGMSSNLVPKQVQVTNSKTGKTYTTTKWVKVGEESKELQPIGEAVSPDINGMKITKYSEKAILITGDTYVNKDDLREVKKEIGVGTWNRKLQGWVFPIKFIDSILSILSSKQSEKGNHDKANAITNQKNESLVSGDSVTVGGESGVVTEGVSDERGTKYNVQMTDGIKLSSVNEKVIDAKPETDDKKIASIINSVTPENRGKTEKKIYGIKSIENIHEYTLEDYMQMHGLTQAEIAQYTSILKPKQTTSNKNTGSSGSRSQNSKNAPKDKALSKRQLAMKLIARHRKSVEEALRSGIEVSPNVLKHYPHLVQAKNGPQTLKELKDQFNLSDSDMKELEKIADTAMTKVLENNGSVGKKPMSEETKRKISEALKKLGTLEDEKKNLKAKRQEIWDNKDEITDYAKRQEEKTIINSRLDQIPIEINRIKNHLKALENGGVVFDYTDATGQEHKDVSDFTRIDTQNIEHDIDTILNIDPPPYVPVVDDEMFNRKGFMFDFVKIGPNRYLASTDSYREKSMVRDGYSISYTGKYNSEQPYVVLTLDQLVLSQEYYMVRQKAVNIKKAHDYNERQTKYWFEKVSESRRESTMNGLKHHNLPAKVRKKVTKEQWEKMPWNEREKHYQHVKRQGVKRVKSRWEDKKQHNKMPSSFHSMVERHENPEWQSTHKTTGAKQKRGTGGGYADQNVWKRWEEARDFMNFKLRDLQVQRENLSALRGKAIETSYGESGTSNELLDKYGIKVKRQNGDKISANHVQQIEDAWKEIQKTFGPLVENARKDGLKISHAGKTYMFASKSVGIFVPSMMTIGVTSKMGNDQLGYTMSHEIAHWIDYSLGQEVGQRYLSNNYDSTAGQIAIKFRENMNRKTESKYLNSTHECFARAMEQYFAMKIGGDDATVYEDEKFINTAQFNSKAKFERDVVPLIEKFLEEHKTFFKAMVMADSFEKALQTLNIA